MPLINPFFRLPGRWTRRRARQTRMAVQLITIAVVVLILLPAYVIYRPPGFVIASFQRRNPDVLFRVDTARKVVALTIDDTPSAHTRDILDALKANDAHATFFVIGDQVPGREDVLDEILRQGHELGNHAMHDEPSISLSSEVLSEQISQVDGYIKDAYSTTGTPRASRLFRPGSGIFSARVVDEARKLGYETTLGSIYPHDPFIKYAAINAWHITSMLRPGAVIICHDRRSWTAPMLKRALLEIKRQGYEIVTISTLLKTGKT